MTPGDRLTDTPVPDGVSGAVSSGREPEAYDRLRRRVLWSLPTGLYVVGARVGSTVNLMTCNLVMQVATTPKLLAMAVERDSLTRRLVEEAGRFSVSVLDRDQARVVRRFVKPVAEVTRSPGGVLQTVQAESVVEVAGGLPVLASAVAWLVCTGVRTVVHPVDATGTGQGTGEGDSDRTASHVLLVGEVADAGEIEPTGRPVLRMEDTRMHYGG